MIRRGFGGPVPYKTLTEEEVEVEPVVTYNCDYCDYRSPTQKGLRCHRITVHRIGQKYHQTCVNRRKAFPFCSEDAVWTLNFVHHERIGTKPVISASVCLASRQVSDCLDYKFSHISCCLDTIKCA
ncbi:hypothetical protein TNCT_511331 [Trichonephila clavata]|uniref:C2H2-type domain-containing protein n=1 Tax=Trichonephila clavata TaxID=2740835 RepID=A0A8X6HYY2_TRICU|nr:hypothetical protein TNCT_511331 [Trichonephila clavata]